MKNVFVYRLQKLADDSDSGGYSNQLKIHRWNPGATRFIPPNSPLPYLYFWFMHYLRLFKSQDYCAYIMFDRDEPVCSLVCVPSLYRWPFMSPGDLQIKNVFTKPECRGKGYASRLVRKAIEELGIGKRMYWYMTDEENIPSQKLCQKIGFEYVGRYQRKRSKFVYKGEIVEQHGVGINTIHGNFDEFEQAVKYLSEHQEERKKMGEKGFKLLGREYSTEKSYGIIMNHFGEN